MTYRGPMVVLTRQQAWEVAHAVLDQRRHLYWLVDGTLEKLAVAAEGRTIGAAVALMEVVLDACSRVAPNDDPHDTFDPFLVAKMIAATKTLPAPGSDPNSKRSVNLSVPDDTFHSF